MSKGEFKQAVGRLLLEGACAFTEDGAQEISQQVEGARAVSIDMCCILKSLYL